LKEGIVVEVWSGLDVERKTAPVTPISPALPACLPKLCEGRFLRLYPTYPIFAFHFSHLLILSFSHLLIFHGTAGNKDVEAEGGNESA
jgi:hypothetical protein